MICTHFYDLNVKSNFSGGENTLEEMVNFAKRLGYAGIVINDNFESLEKIEDIKKGIANLETDMEVYLGVTIDIQDSKNISDLKNIISKVREKVMIVTVSGGDYTINRTASEDSRVDILTHPEMGRTDGGLDEPILKAANVNNVAIEINFREILNSFRKPRSYILNHIASNIRLCENYRIPLVVSSSAKSIWEMRPPREMVSMVNALGLDLGRAFAAVTSIPQEIIEKNKKILEGQRITEGVEVVE